MRLEFQPLDATETTRIRDDEYHSVVTLSAKTATGRFVRVHVFDTPHEIFVACSPEFAADQDNLVCLTQDLNQHLLEHQHPCQQTNCRNGCTSRPNPKSISREMCKKCRECDTMACLSCDIQYRKGMEGREESPRPFIRFILKHAFYAPEACKYLKNIYVGLVPEIHSGVYDLNKSTIRSFGILKKWGAFIWSAIEVEDPNQTDFDVSFNDLILIDNNKIKHAPLSIVGLDIETIARSYVDSDNLTAEYPIGGLVLIHSNTNTAYVFSFAGSTTKLVADYVEPAPEITSKMMVYDTEAEMLTEVLKTLRETIDPDGIITYYGNNFDIPYIIRRYRKLGLGDFELSRVAGCPMFFIDTIQEVASGKRNLTKIDCPGRIFFDNHRKVSSELKLYDNSLNTACEYFGIGSKDDVGYHELYQLFNGPAEGRGKMLSYCAKDVYLTLLLAKKMDFVNSLIALTKVQRCNARDNIEVGISYRLGTAVKQFCHGEYVFRVWDTEWVPKKGKKGKPVIGADGRPEMVSRNKVPPSLARIPGYVECYNRKVKGGYVRDPDYDLLEQRRRKKRALEVLRINEPAPKKQETAAPAEEEEEEPGADSESEEEEEPDKDEEDRDEEQHFNDLLSKMTTEQAKRVMEEPDLTSNRRIHKEPVCTLDFNSLYPSICQHLNICPTTILHSVQGLKKEEYNKSPNGFYFSTKNVGVICRLMEYYVSERKKVKAMMKAETDPDLVAQYDALQLALKLCGNGLYGQLVQLTGDISFKPGGEAITTAGQKYQKKVGKRITEEPKFAHMKPDIIYGDTDSLFIKLKAYADEAACKEFYKDAEWAELQRNVLEIISIETLLTYLPPKVELVAFPDQYSPENFKNQRYDDKITIKNNEIELEDLKKALYRSSYENQLKGFVFKERYPLIEEDGTIKVFGTRDEAFGYCRDLDYVQLVIDRYVAVQTTRRDFKEVEKWVNVDSKILSGVMKMEWEDISFIMLKDKKKYFKLIVSKALGDPISSKIKTVGMTNRSMTPFFAGLAKDLSKRIMIYNEDVRPFIRESIQRVASNQVPMKMLKHTSNLSKPIDDYNKNGKLGSERHVVAARQLRDAGKPVVVGDRVEYYYCLVNGLGKNINTRKMGSQTVAAALMQDYALDLRVYVDEFLKSLEMFACALPAAPKKLFPLSSFSFTTLTQKEMPGTSGPMDAMVTKVGTKKRSLERPSESWVQPNKRQTTLFEQFIKKA